MQERCWRRSWPRRRAICCTPAPAAVHTPRCTIVRLSRARARYTYYIQPAVLGVLQAGMQGVHRTGTLSTYYSPPSP